MDEKSYHPIFAPERISGFNGDWAVDDTLKEVRKLSNGVEKLLDQDPAFDWKLKPLEQREEERQFLLDCKEKLSVMATDLESMMVLWLTHWNT